MTLMLLSVPKQRANYHRESGSLFAGCPAAAGRRLRGSDVPTDRPSTYLIDIGITLGAEQQDDVTDLDAVGSYRKVGHIPILSLIPLALPAPHAASRGMMVGRFVQAFQAAGVDHCLF
ncbi:MULTISPECIES: hypothetical protein [unclassified Bradyrhizobium]|uniref:hypothetical protein n=1 Tax=unclassified Bradyrhizobium TaxID=2631580 RepID=UPI001CD489C9|nr:MULTISPECIES: hypothetical protein [unclassified Bradyrhizobium]MCA1378766.1 hypothetical protein [Bradyrhizobium sp. IC4060]MCA1487784.1 hypothetical protein [Bradyrhizobium sp. IC4061]